MLHECFKARLEKVATLFIILSNLYENKDYIAFVTRINNRGRHVLLCRFLVLRLYTGDLILII